MRVQALTPDGPSPVIRKIVDVVAVRTAGDPLLFVSAVRGAIAHADREQPVTRVRTMDVAAESIAKPRFRAQLVGAVAMIAVVLASVGFGVLAFSGGRRTREFGIRMALGVCWSDIIGLVLRSGLKVFRRFGAYQFLEIASLRRATARPGNISDNRAAAFRSSDGPLSGAGVASGLR
jgi:hypothetical protein